MSLDFAPEQRLATIDVGDLITSQGLQLEQDAMYCAFASGRGLIFERTNMLWRDGEWVEMNSKPFELLTFLALQAGKVVSGDEIYEELYGLEYEYPQAKHRVYKSLLPLVRNALGRDGLGDPHGGAIRAYDGVGLKLLA